MQPTIFSVFITCVLVLWPFADKAPKSTLSSQEIKDLLRRDPETGYNLMKMKMTFEKDLALKDKDLALKDKDLEIERLIEKLQDNEENAALIRYCCMAEMLGQMCESLSNLWKNQKDYDKKTIQEFNASRNYYDCFQYLNGQSDPKLGKYFVQQQLGYGAENASSDEYYKNVWRDQIRSRILESGFTIHDYCITYWKTWELRSRFVDEIKDRFNIVYKFNFTLKDTGYHPKFGIRGELQFTENDVPKLNLILETMNFKSRVLMKQNELWSNSCP